MNNNKLFSLFALLGCLLLSTATFANPKTGIQYLSGTGYDDAVDWEFFCTGGRNSGRWTTIPVPSCWELQGFGTYQYGMPFYGKANPPGIANEQGLYKVKFKLPAEWEGRVIRIVFDGVMTDYEAQINGRRCGHRHQGAFYRFKNDVSDRVFFGDKENVLEVTVSKESANASVNLAERRADYWNFGGIFRPVFVEALPAQNIDRLAVDAKADGSLYADVFLGAALSSDYKVVAKLSDRQGKAIGRSIETQVREGSDRVVMTGHFNQIQTWTPETPNLYYVDFALMKGNQVIHEVRQRIGFRTIEVRESDGLYINGQRVLIKGVNRHSFRPESGRTLSREANFEDVRLMKSMNMNAVRLAHYPSDPEFLDACDELGLYVMVELAGWHGKYDTTVGTKLVREMVTRDVNHPSVIWWANGNEGGHNHDLVKEYIALDPQKRPVLHPQKNFGGFETMHYRSYGESMEYMRQPEIWMPTEFLHGLYDGGHGAGLWDYWEVMRKFPRCAGGFLWVFADEGVVRTDQNGRIDNVGNYGADGIVGPHHEKEGSYYTIKEVWSPIQIMDTELPANFNGRFTVENRYDFTDLSQCRFEWSLKTLDWKNSKVLASGKGNAPKLAPRETGTLSINLPSDWRKADMLSLTVFGPNNEELWTWDWSWSNPQTTFAFNTGKTTLSSSEENNILAVKAGNLALTFCKQTGHLSQVMKGNQLISLSNGPRFVAARRGDRSKDVYYNHDDKDARSKERIYEDITGTDRLTSLTCTPFADSIVVVANYVGEMQQVRWVVSADGNIRMDYAYYFDGTVELMGVAFDYPEQNVLSKRWAGNGPYRVWQNRLHGTNIGIWENDYNDPIPGETFIYPEFKGYFAGWKWASFTTTEGTFSIGNAVKEDSYLGVFTPRDGRDALLYTLPQTGISVLKVIPAVRNKVNATDLVGPSSLPKWVNGLHQGSVYFNF